MILSILSSEVEKFCNSMTTTAEISTLGPSGSISQDSVYDKTGLYRNVWLTYQVMLLSI